MTTNARPYSTPWPPTHPDDLRELAEALRPFNRDAWHTLTHVVRGPRWFWRTFAAWLGAYFAIVILLGRGRFAAAWGLGLLLVIPVLYVLRRGEAVDKREGIVRDTEAWRDRNYIRQGFVMLGVLLLLGFTLIVITVVMVASD